MSKDHAEVYAERYETLVDTASNLESHIQSLLRDTPHIDRISARAKGPSRFAAKAVKEGEGGGRKYADPLLQIQDQIGARVIVFYKQDVERVATVLERYFRPIERQDLVPESDWEFGYFGRHWVFALIDDVVPRDADRDEVPRFFELQVKTLFQHAWSEANHDLGYKSPVDLSADQRRRFAYTAAQAWGADRVFAELHTELAEAPEAIA
jgi:ppGpp synthetase/RelA/SpoT-type nucleotidyltranferase